MAQTTNPTKTWQGHCHQSSVAELRLEAEQWAKQVAGYEYDEMGDWFDDNVILDADRKGYEEDWPTPVSVILNGDGTFTIK